MSKVARVHHVEVLSDVAAAVQSAAVYLGGNDWDVQFVGAGALFEVQGSHDKLHWVVTHDIGGDPITLGDETVPRVGLERPAWLRLNIALDAGGPVRKAAIFLISKRAHG